MKEEHMRYTEEKEEEVVGEEKEHMLLEDDMGGEEGKTRTRGKRSRGLDKPSWKVSTKVYSHKAKTFIKLVSHFSHLNGLSINPHKFSVAKKNAYKYTKNTRINSEQRTHVHSCVHRSNDDGDNRKRNNN